MRGGITKSWSNIRLEQILIRSQENIHSDESTGQSTSTMEVAEASENEVFRTRLYTVRGHKRQEAFLQLVSKCSMQPWKAFPDPLRY